MAPGDNAVVADGAMGRREPLGIDAWVLCREFVERIVTEAQAAAARDDPGYRVGDVDWESIWRAGDGAPSDEAAIGRIVRAASGAAQGIALGVFEPASADRVGGEVGHQPVLTHPLPAAADSVALVEPVVVPAESVTATVEPLIAEAVAPATAPEAPVTALVDPAVAPVEPLTDPAEPVTAIMNPVTAPTEPVTAPEVLATPAVESVTLERPDLRATTAVEPAVHEEFEIAPIAAGDADPDGVATGRLTRTHHAAWATVFTWIRNLGAIMLLFVAWQLWGTAISQHQAQDQLKAAFDASLKAHHPLKATALGPTLIPASAKLPSPPDGSVLARLQIPAIGLDQYVVAGTSSAQLAQGPGHYDGTALPGQAGNVAIAGHRTTHGAPFNRLGQLASGDPIILTTLSGQHLAYVVSGAPQAVSPNDVAVLNYFGDNRITLTTCTPEFSAAQRLIVVGELKLPSTALKAPPAQHISYHITNSATASWDWSLLPAVGIEVCLLLLLGLSYRRFDLWFGRTGKWVVFVPLWAAGLYLLFASLTGFLPETL